MRTMLTRTIALAGALCAAGCDSSNNTSGSVGGLRVPDLSAVRTVTAPNRDADLLTGMDVVDDARIVMIVHAANAGEIAIGKVAETKASEPKVKAYAKMLVADHTAADRSVDELAHKDSITPAKCPTSEDLERGARAALDHLQAMKGADFDRAYVDAQVEAHQKVLALIDDQLMRRAASTDVRTLLEGVRAKIIEHYDAGRLLQTELKK